MQRHENKMHNLKSYNSWLKKSAAVTKGSSIEEYNTQKEKKSIRKLIFVESSHYQTKQYFQFLNMELFKYWMHYLTATDLKLLV